MNYDAFISYSRADSKEFVLELHDKLVRQGLRVWVDRHDIPPAVDWQDQIEDGIERAHNFIFVIAPRAIESKYCLQELASAVKLKKRIVPLLHVPVERDKRPAELRRLNWIYAREESDDLEEAFSKLQCSLAREREYVAQHTELLVKALQWARSSKRLDLLLVGSDRKAAEAWLKRTFHDAQAPCEPPELLCEYICESIKNAEGLLTDVFMSYASQDREVMLGLRAVLMREGLTIWSDRTEIETGREFQEEIDRGIEGADTLIYLLSEHSLASQYCQAELTYAKRLNKRIIPIRLERVAREAIPSEIGRVQHIDALNWQDKKEFQATAGSLLKTLHDERYYYSQHKKLLVKALKWDRQNKNPSILLRGHNLQHYSAWHDVVRSRKASEIVPIQTEFLAASLANPPEASLDVFISYSRANSDFARKLNEALQFQGKTTWFDQESIPSGGNYQEEIYKGIKISDNFLFVISPQSVNSQYCDGEVEYAHSLGKRISTVLCRPTNASNLPKHLAKIQWIDFTGEGGSFYTKFGELVRNLDIDREHVKKHTKWLLRAQEWTQKDKSSDLLLRGNELAIATEWLQEVDRDNKQPPATAGQRELIENSQQALDAEEKREKKRLLVLRSLLGVVTGALAISIGLGIEAYREFRHAALSEAKATTRSAEALLASDRQLEALLAILDAKQTLADLKVKQGELASYSDSILSRVVLRTREANRLSGHEREVYDVELHSDNRAIATASADKTIKIWGLDGKLLETLTGHNGPVWDVSFSPDGRTLVSASGDRTIKVWQSDENGRNYRPIRTLKEHGDIVYEIEFHPDGLQFASVSGDGTVKLWPLAGTASTTTLQGNLTELYALAFSPDGRWLATGDAGGKIELWERQGATYLKMRTLEGHQGWISKLAFSPDGELLASSSEDHLLKLWNVADGSLANTLTGHQDVVWGIVWEKTGQRLISGSWDRTLRLWSRSGTQIRTLRGHQQRVRGLDIDLDNAFVLSASADETVKIWRYDNKFLKARSNFTSGLWRIVASGDLVAIVSNDSTVSLFASKPPEEFPTFATLKPTQVLSGHETGTWGAAISPDGQLIATSGWDRTIKLWQRDGTLLGTLRGHQGPVRGIAFGPRGKLLVSAGVDRTVKLWVVDRANPDASYSLETLTGHGDAVLEVSVSPDGRYLASGSQDGTVRVWPLLSAGRSVRVGDPVVLSEHTDEIHDVGFSADSQYLASVSADRTARTWKIEGDTLAIVPDKVLEGHRDEVYSVALQGEIVATGSLDETVRLWRLRDGKLLSTLSGHDAEVTKIAFAKDNTLLSVSVDRSLLAWNLAEILQEDAILAHGCNWVVDYLSNHPQDGPKDLDICDRFSSQPVSPEPGGQG